MRMERHVSIVESHRPVQVVANVICALQVR
jgi:hypothetical protein